MCRGHMARPSPNHCLLNLSITYICVFSRQEEEATRIEDTAKKALNTSQEALRIAQETLRKPGDTMLEINELKRE